LVKSLFGEALHTQGRFVLNADQFEAISQYGFVSGASSHADRLATIRQTYEDFGVIVDTHTADGLKVAHAHVQRGITMLVLETALPAKFAATIVEAIGIEPPRPAGLENIEALPKRVVTMAVDVAAVKAFVEQHV